MDPDKKKFILLVVLAQIVGVTAVILMAVWMGNYQGGFGWEQNKFNHHPLFMVIGLILLYGDGEYSCTRVSAVAYLVLVSEKFKIKLRLICKI